RRLRRGQFPRPLRIDRARSDPPRRPDRAGIITMSSRRRSGPTYPSASCWTAGALHKNSPHSGREKRCSPYRASAVSITPTLTLPHQGGGNPHSLPLDGGGRGGGEAAT